MNIRRWQTLLFSAAPAVTWGAVLFIGASFATSIHVAPIAKSRGTSLVPADDGTRSWVLRATDGRRLGTEIGLGARIGSLPFVRRVEPELFTTIALPKHDYDAIILSGWDCAATSMRRLKIVAGQRLTAGQDRSLLLGEMLAKNLNLKVGNFIDLKPGERFEVVGIFTSESILETGGMIVMSLPAAQRLANLTGRVTVFMVLVDGSLNYQQIDQLCERVAELEAGVTMNDLGSQQDP